MATLVGKASFSELMEDDEPIELIRGRDSIRGTLAALRDEVAQLARELARSPESKTEWLTPEQAVQLVPISRTRLDQLATDFGHLEGGPVNVASRNDTRRKLLFQRSTLHDWLRRACPIRPPDTKQSPKRRQRVAPVLEMVPMNWDDV